MTNQNALQLLEDAIIPIFETKERKLLVSARTLHAALDVESKFADWFLRRVDRFRLVENQDYVKVPELFSDLRIIEPKRRGPKNIEYALVLNTAMHLAMAEETDKKNKSGLGD